MSLERLLSYAAGLSAIGTGFLHTNYELPWQAIALGYASVPVLSTVHSCLRTYRDSGFLEARDRMIMVAGAGRRTAISTTLPAIAGAGLSYVLHMS